MLSRLAVGYGSWTGQTTPADGRREGRSLGESGVKWYGESGESAARSLTHSDQLVESSRTGASFPKTYLTRKGALILFSSRENHEQRELTTQTAGAQDASALVQLPTLDSGNISKLFNPHPSSGVHPHPIGRLCGSSASRSAGHPARRLQCRPRATERAAPDLAAHIAEVKSSVSRRRQNLLVDSCISPSHRDWLASDAFPAAAYPEYTDGQMDRPSTSFSDFTAFSPGPVHQLTLVPASSLKTATLSESWINYIIAEKIGRARIASTSRQLKRPSSSEGPDRQHQQQPLSAHGHPSAEVHGQSRAPSPRHARDQQPAAVAAELRAGRLQRLKVRAKRSDAGRENCLSAERPRDDAGANLETSAAGTEYESDSALFVEDDILLPAGSESLDTSSPLHTDAEIKTSEGCALKATTDYDTISDTWPTAAEPTKPISTMRISTVPVADNMLMDDRRASSDALIAIPTLESYYSAEAQKAGSSPLLILHEAGVDGLIQHSGFPIAAGDTSAAAAAATYSVVIQKQRDKDHGQMQQSDLSTSADGSWIDGVLASEETKSCLPQNNQSMSSRRIKSSDRIAGSGSRGHEARDGKASHLPSGLMQQRHDYGSGRQLEHFPTAPDSAADEEKSQGKLCDAPGTSPLHNAPGQLGDIQVSPNQLSHLRSEGRLLTDETTGGYTKGPPSSHSAGIVGSREPQTTAATMPQGRALLPDTTGSSNAGNKLAIGSPSTVHPSDTDSLSRNVTIHEDVRPQPLPNVLKSTSSRCIAGDPPTGMTIDKPKKTRKKDVRSRKSLPQQAAENLFDASLAANSVDDDYVMPTYVSSLLSRPMIQLSDVVSADELAVVEETLRLKLEEATARLAVEPELRASTAAKPDGRLSTARSKKQQQQRAALSADVRNSLQLEVVAAKRELARRTAQREKAERCTERDKLSTLVSELRDRHGSTRASDRLASLQEEESAARAAIEALQTEEDEARQALARARETSRGERDYRRQNEDQQARLAKTQQLAEQRQLKRTARQKQLTLLESIIEPEALSRLWEDERRREEEEAWHEELRQEEEERRAMIAAEEEEARISEIEKKAEEEAMQNMMANRAAAEKTLADVQLRMKQLLSEIEQKRNAMEAEEHRLMERMRASLEEERLKEEEDRRRAQTMARLEQETRDRLRHEAELRRQHIMALRRKNLDAKANLSTIRRNQGINKAWVFSYYVRWPRETQERLIGSGNNEGGAIGSNYLP